MIPSQEKKQRSAGVNALKGATSISTAFGHPGYIHMEESVNALKGATSISTREKNTNSVWIKCVNALKGATSISTLASGNPHK